MKTMQTSTFSDLDPIYQYLLTQAYDAMGTAYDPYSKFSVGAALMTDQGLVVTGSNFANASSGATICAERSAIMRANALGMRKFDMIAIIAKGEEFDTAEPTAPCGICRQVIFEVAQLMGEDIEVIMSNTRMDKIYISTISELLPLGFGPKDLGIDISRF